MTKAGLIEELHKKKELPTLSKRATAEFVDTVFLLVAKSVRKNKKFTYPGFGTWSIRKRKTRKGRNPRTGETIEIKGSKTVVFKPAPTFKRSIS